MHFNSVAQPDRDKRITKVSQPQNKALISKVDSLSDRLSDALGELTKLRKQNRDLSDKVETIESAMAKKQSKSENGALSLSEAIILIAAIALGSGGTLLFRRWRRRRQPSYKEHGGHRLSNSEVDSRLTELNRELKYLKDRQRQIDESLKLLESKIAHSATPATSERRSEWNYPAQSLDNASPTPKMDESSPLQELVSTYNAALGNETERSRFRDIYRVSRIGVQNAMERRRDSSLPPLFQTASEGDYYAIDIRDQGSSKFAIVPRFDLTLQESNYILGAIGTVFRCSGFNANLRYRHFKLDRPAFFSRGFDESWNLVEPGELNIGEGE